MEKFLKFFPLIKVDEKAHIAYGLVTAEDEDSDGESCVYDDPSKPMDAKRAYKAWSEECLKSTTAAGQDPSLGNVRQMHQLLLGGKVVKLDFDDAAKQVLIGVEPDSDDTWKKVSGGFYRGFSQGGNYAWRGPVAESPRKYAPVIGEVSFVDNPSLKRATFSYVKADGSMEIRKFASAPDLPPGISEDAFVKLSKSIREDLKREQVAETRKADQRKESKSAIIAFCKRKEIPLAEMLERASLTKKFIADPLDKGMYTVAQIAQCLETLNYIRQDLEWEREFEGDESTSPDDLNTILEELCAFLTELVAEETSELLAEAAAKGNKAMNPEQIKKAAAALGISEEEFKKLLASETLEKAKTGIAALHGHIEKAISHHEAMHKAHKALGDMHAEHAAHLGKCMKACAGVMGDDGKKALTAEELEKAEKDRKAEADRIAAEAAKNNGMVKLEDVNALIKTALDAQAVEFNKKLDALPADDTKNIRLIPRNGDSVVAKAGTVTNPYGA